MTRHRIKEIIKCRLSAAYFVHQYVHIYDAAAGDWRPMKLWPAQLHVVEEMERHPRLIILKARQLGLTWLALSYALWRMLFHPAATVLVYSRRQEEAIYLLSEERLRGTYARLPAWLRAAEERRTSARTWELGNGSVVHAFPTTAGDGYTASLAIVDEADLVPDLGRLLRSAKPTIDGGGQIMLLSRANKSAPGSLFQRLFQEAATGRTDWHPLFLPWHARPDRDAAWYEAVRREVQRRTGSLDELFEQYPATAEEALAARQQDRRLPVEWVRNCWQPSAPLPAEGLYPGAPSQPGLCIYRLPRRGGTYVVGADPAEGNPHSDDSALTVLAAATGEEAAALAGRFEPAAFAAVLDEIARFYLHAPVLVERNNHGHAVLLWLADHGHVPLLNGPDDKPGWLSTLPAKALLLSHGAEALRDSAVVIHSPETVAQLLSIEGATLRAPRGQADDRAISLLLALEARRIWMGQVLAPVEPAAPFCAGNVILQAPPGVFAR